MGGWGGQRVRTGAAWEGRWGLGIGPANPEAPHAAVGTVPPPPAPRLNNGKRSMLFGHTVVCGQYKSTTAGSGTGCGATREAEMVEAPTNSLVKYNLRLTSPTNHAKTSGPSGQQRAWDRTPSSAPRAPASSGLPRESGGSTPDLWKHRWAQQPHQHTGGGGGDVRGKCKSPKYTAIWCAPIHKNQGIIESQFPSHLFLFSLIHILKIPFVSSKVGDGNRGAPHPPSPTNMVWLSWHTSDFIRFCRLATTAFAVAFNSPWITLDT